MKNKRLLKLFLCTCSCAKLSDKEIEDGAPYERRSKIDDSTDLSVEEVEPSENNNNDQKSERDSLLSNDSNLTRGSSYDNVEEVPVIRQKRPNKWRWSIPQPGQGLHRQDFQIILLKLDNQTEKLNNILYKVDNQDEMTSKLYSKVKEFKTLVQDAKDKIATIDSGISDSKSQSFLRRSVLRSNSGTSTAVQHDERRSILRSTSGTSTAVEHDEIFGSAQNSAEIADIIRDQFNELKRCAVEHKQQKAENEAFSEVMLQMDTDLESLPISPRDREAFFGHFIRRSYPSPIGTEYIPLGELSPRGRAVQSQCINYQATSA